jgi:hypothetical protein
LESRGRELALLEGGRRAGTVPVVSLDGMAGTGKTALAVHAAHRLASGFPDGQLFVDLHGHARDAAPSSSSACASSSTDLLRGCHSSPFSSRRTVLTLSPACSASCSWVINARLRHPRSSLPAECPPPGSRATSGRGHRAEYKVSPAIPHGGPRQKPGLSINWQRVHQNRVRAVQATDGTTLDEIGRQRLMPVAAVCQNDRHGRAG